MYFYLARMISKIKSEFPEKEYYFVPKYTFIKANQFNMKQYLFLVLVIAITIITACGNKETISKKDGNRAVKITEVESTSAEGIKEKTYSRVDEMPRFPGCEDKDISKKEIAGCANTRMNNYIHNRLRYPKIAFNNHIEGMIVARFVVRPDGLLDDISIHNDIGYGCGETVISIIQSMNHMNERWIPGKLNGKPVRVRLALPIEFKIP